jgi:lipopolysaccharide/colanic/teichoic acid biosynthesis glycosyltransferase
MQDIQAQQLQAGGFENNGADSQFSVALNPVVQKFSYRISKRAMDIFMSSFGFLFLFPIFVAIAALVKSTSKGPIFYNWDVIGRGGRPFRGYKFRTMVVNADELKKQLLAQNEMIGPVFKIRDDPRITPIGRYLRKYSLDELPQLWSILKGDMSLIGPRPAGPHEWEKYLPWQRAKLSVTPGLSCLWQVNGRNKISCFDDWVRLDLEYIDNWSLWLDFKIILKSVYAVLQGTGA